MVKVEPISSLSNKKTTVKRTQTGEVIDLTPTLSLTPSTKVQHKANSSKANTTKTTYNTVMPMGTHGKEVFEAPSTTQKVVDNNKAFREADQENYSKVLSAQQRAAELKQSRAERMERLNTMKSINNKTVEPVEKAKIDLSTVATSLSKQAKYYKLSKNLTTLYTKTIEAGEAKNAKATKDAAWTSGGLALLAIATSFIPVAGPYISAAVNAANPFISSIVGKQDYSYQAQAQKYSNLSDSIIGYMESLENRDTYITSAMNSITSTMQGMRSSYGDAFVDQFYNLMLAKNGMTPDAYSLLTGNFRVFNENRNGYGTESGEAGLFDELTTGYGDLFNNVYKQLEMSDIEGISTSLTQALFSGNTEIGEQLRGYELDLKTTMQNFLNSQQSALSESMSNLFALNEQAREANISYAEQLGSAQEQRASSGFRGGTSTANEALARLSADMGRMASSAQASNIINSLRYLMKQQELNASSTAYNYRSAQKQLGISARNQALSSFTSIGQVAGEGGNQADKQLINAKEYQNQAEKDMEEFSEEEKNILLDGVSY